MKKALITGIAGQDGSYLAEFLLEKDYRVFGVDMISTIRDPLRLWRIAHIVDQIELFPASVEDYPRIREVIERVRPDECYHLAASSFVSYEFDDIFSMFNTNFHGTHSLLNAILETVPECRIYYAGSSEMFGDTRESPQNEETPFYPRSAYGISKLSGFHLARNFRETHGLFISTGIAYNHESERRSPEFVTRKITKKVAEIYSGFTTELRLGNLEARRDWGYAPEYVHAMWLILQQSEPDVYVLATGKSHSVRDFVDQAFTTVGLKWEDYIIIDKEFYRPSEKVELVGDGRKAERLLPWKPQIDFDGIIERMVMHDIHSLKK